MSFFLNSPQLTGNPTAPTQALTDNSTKLANTAFIKSQGYLTGNQPITISGDGAGSGSTAITFTLAASGVVAGTYKSVTVDAKGRVISGTNPTTLNGYGITDAINLNLLGAANGIAGLDASGKVPTSQLPSSVLGGLSYQGTWDAAANNPSISSGSASASNKGYYYKVGTSGNTTVDGSNGWHSGDWIVSNGTTWDKIDNYEAVLSVNGATGNIILTTANIAEGTNLYYTNARAISATLTGFSATAGGAISATDTILQGLQKVEYKINSAVTGVSSVNGASGSVVLTTANISEGVNLYFTSARVLGQTLAGYSVGASTALSAADSILAAFGKVQGQINTLAPLNNAALTGIPTVPTAAAGTSTTQAASTAFVAAAVAVNSSPIAIKTAAYTATIADFTILCDATAAAFSVTLPTAPTNGMVLNIKKIDASANLVTITGGTVDGASSVGLTGQWQAYTLQYLASASAWYVI